MKTIYAVIGCGMLAGCVNLQTDISPVKLSNDKAICIAENPRVYEGFVNELESVIKARGYNVLRFDNESLINDNKCSARLTYNVKRRWDFGYYIGLMDINVYSMKGVRVGGIYYDMDRGGNFSKYGTATEKLTPLVSKMLVKRGGSD